MRRLRRMLLNLLTGVCLVLGVVAVGMWVRSYRSLDRYRRMDRDAPRVYLVASVHGGLQVARIRNLPERIDTPLRAWGNGWETWPLHPWPPSGAPPDRDWQLLYDPATSRDRRLLGFRHVTGWFDGFSPFWSVRVPYWSVVVASLPLPLVRVTRWRRHRRARRKGHCPACGYDLRATPARCPECGRAAGG